MAIPIMEHLKKINKKLLPMKGHYFLFNAGTGPMISFLSIYAKQLGFSSFIVGLVYTILPLCGMIAKPIMGAIADRFQCQKRIFLGSQLVVVVAYLALFYSPQVPIDKKVDFICSQSGSVFNSIPKNDSNGCAIDELKSRSTIESCSMSCPVSEELWHSIQFDWHVDELKNKSKPNWFSFTSLIPTEMTEQKYNYTVFTVHDVVINNAKYQPVCSTKILTNCNADCNDYSINEIVSVITINDDEVYDLYQFWVFLSLMILGWVAQAIAVSIGDTICFELLGDQPEKYGAQRLFGALGWGIASAIGGFIIDTMSEGKNTKDFSGAFYLGCSIIVLDFIVSSTIKYEQQKLSQNILHDIGRVITNLKVCIYLIWCIGMGMCTALMWNFLFWLVEELAQGCDAMTWIKTLEGLIMTIQCVGGETPFFFLSGYIIKKLGHVNCMSLVLFAIGVRFILYSVISDPWWFLPIEFSNGITFGLFYACMASYASIVAPEGTEATMQGFVGAIFEGVGVSIGSFVAGYLFKDYGGPLTFRMFGVGAIILSILHAAIQYFLKWKV